MTLSDLQTAYDLADKFMARIEKEGKIVFTDNPKAEDFLRSTTTNIPAEWRIGQAMFNGLLQVRPDLAEKVRGTDKDPFYAVTRQDDRVTAFEQFARENW